MDFKIITQDWREKLAAGAPPKKDLEVTFMQQAHQVVENKVPFLMKDPYLVGFEIVDKNNSNTKMVGIFAYRTQDGALFYAPVFFAGGEIKGANLLYSVKEKLFYPLSNDWAKFLTEKSANSQDGRPAEKDLRDQSRVGIQFSNLARPQFMRGGTLNTKRASDFDFQAAWEEVRTEGEKVASELAQSAKPGKVLPKLFAGKGGMGLFNNLAEKVASDPGFAKQLYRHYSEEELFGFEPYAEETKEASAPGLVLHVGRFNADAKEASSVQLSRGYSYEDNREKHAAVYADMVETVESIQESGICADVLFQDGSKRTTCVFNKGCAEDLLKSEGNLEKDYDDGHTNSIDGKEWDGAYTHRDQDEVHSYGNTPHKLLWVSDEKSTCSTSGRVYGKSDYNKTPDSMAKSYKSLSKGDSCIIYVKCCDKAVGPYYVSNVKTKHGITHIGLTGCHGEDYEDYTLCVNPDLESSDTALKVYAPDDICVLTVNTEGDDYKHFKRTDSEPGSDTTVMHMLTRDVDGYKQATIKSASHDRFHVHTEDGMTPELNRQGAVGYIMHRFSATQGDAEELADAANERRKASFWYEKQAAIRMEQIPEFFVSHDGDFGVDVGRYESHMVQGESVAEHPPPTPRVGDKYQSEGMNPATNDMSPDELHAWAEQTGEEHVFDHGVVGNLVKTYNAETMIDQYIPDMVKGLDRVGRILFLFYWRPEDFSRLYGSDDTSGLENLLLSTFDQYGDLVLELKRKFFSDDNIDMSDFTG